MSVRQLTLVLMTLASLTWSAERTIRYGFLVENKTGQMVRGAQLWTYAPLVQTAYQDRQSLTASHPFTEGTDALGNRILHFKMPDLAPYQRMDVRIQCQLHMSAMPKETADDDRGLVTGPLFELNASAVDSLSTRFAQLTADKAAEQILRWSAGHIRYTGYEKRDRGAAYAFEDRRGDCTEYMALSAALCRLQGIPARGLAGVVRDQSGWINPADLHNWTEVKLNGRWWVLDPLKMTFKERGGEYIALYRVGDVENDVQGYARFRFEGEGLRVSMRKGTQ